MTSKSKKMLLIAGAIVLLVIVIILATRNGDGQSRADRQAAREAGRAAETAPITQSISEAAPQTIDIQEEGLTINGTHPTFTVEAVNKALLGFVDGMIEDFRNTNSDAESKTLNFSTKSYISSEFVNIVVSANSNVDFPSVYSAVINIDGKVTMLDDLLKNGFETKLSGYVKDQLRKRFPNPSSANDLDAYVDDPEQLLSQYRIADNGIVVVIPTVYLTGNIGTHEVLVPAEVYEEEFKNY